LCNFGGLSPALAFVLCDSEAPANRRMPIASAVGSKPRKKEKDPFLLNRITLTTKIQELLLLLKQLNVYNYYMN